ncbi:MAG TPA: hypothetical protein VNB90_16180 [Cytophagaceae bacterium]|nr:hypothetical protein [Cytophagaceae bacterium]
MKAVDILHNMLAYETFLSALKERENDRARQTKGFVKLVKNLSCEYDFITLRLTCQTRSGVPGFEYTNERVYCQLSFEISNGRILFKELYHEEVSYREILEKEVRENPMINDLQWQTKMQNSFFLNDTITHYLSLADEIAAVAAYCAVGDSYRPGAYSEISMGEDLIKLSQINHMNSRSLDHKEDYSLRKLQFQIPLRKLPPEDRRYDFEFGEMGIHFSDYSSPNNKHCGKAILSKILELKNKQN